jgi:hypothetical protein
MTLQEGVGTEAEGGRAAVGPAAAAEDTVGEECIAVE